MVLHKRLKTSLQRLRVCKSLWLGAINHCPFDLSRPIFLARPRFKQSDGDSFLFPAVRRRDETVQRGKRRAVSFGCETDAKEGDFIGRFHECVEIVQL